MAEDEENDESFGDFKFASFPNQQQFPSTFVQNNASNSFNATNSTKPFDPFTVSSDPLDNKQTRLVELFHFQSSVKKKMRNLFLVPVIFSPVTVVLVL
jgi:hypothetical protein